MARIMKCHEFSARNAAGQHLAMHMGDNDILRAMDNKHRFLNG